jgi:L-ascorbate oxidase
MFCNADNINTACPANASLQFCSCIHLIEVDFNDLVEFVFVGETLTQFKPPIKVNHPIHLHGHAFAVVSMDKVFKLFLNITTILYFLCIFRLIIQMDL